MTEISAIIIGAFAGLLSGLITAYITTVLKIKEEKAKWNREFSIRYLDAKFNNQGYEQEIAAQYAIGYIAIYPAKDFAPARDPIPNFFGTPLNKVFIPQNIRLIAGRSPDNDIVLNHHGVSQKHIIFIADAADTYVQDLQTVAGIYIQGRNGEKQRIRGLHKLRSGDCIAVSGYVILYHRIGV